MLLQDQNHHHSFSVEENRHRMAEHLPNSIWLCSNRSSCGNESCSYSSHEGKHYYFAISEDPGTRPSSALVFLQNCAFQSFKNNCRQMPLKCALNSVLGCWARCVEPAANWLEQAETIQAEADFCYGRKRRIRAVCRTGDGFLSLSLSLRGDGIVVRSAVSSSLLAENEGSEATATEIGNVGISSNQENASLKRDNALNMPKHLWAGAVSAIVSRTIVAPLERLKLEYILRGEERNLFGLVQHIMETQGFRSLWKGNAVNILRTAPFKAVNFYAYDTYRKKLLELTGNAEPTNFERFIAGAAAGITATTLCLPMDTIRTKMIAPGGEALGGVVGVCKHMVQTEGLFSLYKGFLPAIISVAPSAAVFYGIYDILKTSYLHSPEGKKRLRQIKAGGKGEFNALEQLELGPIRTLIHGAIAGAAAEAATYPLEVVRRHLQMQGPHTQLNALATCVKIMQQGGVDGLYAGLVPSMLQVLPSAAISYFVYESMKVLLKVE